MNEIQLLRGRLIPATLRDLKRKGFHQLPHVVRSYLGKRYQERDEIRESGGLTKKGLPIVVIYFLGFNLEPDMSACVKVDRRCLNLITRRRIKAECGFIEGLSHDLYVIQAGKLNHKVKTDLERILSVFGQVDFADKQGHDIDFPEGDRESQLLKQIIRRLPRSEKKKKMSAKARTSKI